MENKKMDSNLITFACSEFLKSRKEPVEFYNDFLDKYKNDLEFKESSTLIQIFDDLQYVDPKILEILEINNLL